jgi:hypothetical protein
MMKRDRAVRRTAVAVRRHVNRGVKYHVSKPVFAVVTAPPPNLLCELVAADDPTTSPAVVLDDDDLTFSQTARRYDIDFGIEIGDTLVLLPVASGDWVVMTVVSEKIGFEGISPKTKGSNSAPVDSEGGLLRSGVDFWGAWKDKDGKVIGWVPVWPD